MPGMSGLTLQEELKQRGVRSSLIFMTGYGDVSSCLRAMKNGALEFLEKPLNEQQLLNAVYCALELDRGLLQPSQAAFVTGLSVAQQLRIGTLRDLIISHSGVRDTRIRGSYEECWFG